MSYTFYIWHTHSLEQDLSMHVKNLTPVTLTLTSESAFRCQNLRLGYETCSILSYQLRYTFKIWHTHAFRQDLSMHIKFITPVTLTFVVYGNVLYKGMC